VTPDQEWCRARRIECEQQGDIHTAKFFAKGEADSDYASNTRKWLPVIGRAARNINRKLQGNQ